MQSSQGPAPPELAPRSQSSWWPSANCTATVVPLPDSLGRPLRTWLWTLCQWGPRSRRAGGCAHRQAPLGGGPGEGRARLRTFKRRATPQRAMDHRTGAHSLRGRTGGQVTAAGEGIAPHSQVSVLSGEGPEKVCTAPARNTRSGSPVALVPSRSISRPGGRRSVGPLGPSSQLLGDSVAHSAPGFQAGDQAIRSHAAFTARGGDAQALRKGPGTS